MTKHQKIQLLALLDVRARLSFEDQLFIVRLLNLHVGLGDEYRISKADAARLDKLYQEKA